MHFKISQTRGQMPALQLPSLMPLEGNLNFLHFGSLTFKMGIVVHSLRLIR